jgi:hypothetical protein
MASKTLGPLTWGTGVDLSGLRKDLKAAEGELQKSAKKSVSGGGGVGGKGFKIPTSMKDLKTQAKEWMSGGGEGGGGGGGIKSLLNRIPGMDKLSGMGGGGAGSLAAPLAVIGYALKRESESTKHFAEVAAEAKKFKMKPQDYAREVYGGLGVNNDDFQRAQWRSREAHQWGKTKEMGKNWLGAQGAVAKDYFWGAVRTPWEALENGRTGWTAMSEERAADDKAQDALMSKYKRFSNLSRAGAAPLIENGMGQHAIMAGLEVAKEQAWYTREAAWASKKLVETWGVKSMEGPA